jgi:hypothetical protein
MMNQIPDPRREIDELSRVVAEALAHSKTGLAVNLSDLEARANRICEYLLALPALEARPYAARLERLIDGMNALEDAIASGFGALAAGVGPHGPVMHAAK